MFGLIIAFKNYKITGGKSFIYNLFHSDWAGFKNFSFLIKSNDLFVILRNTILYNLAFIVLGKRAAVSLKCRFLRMAPCRRTSVPRSDAERLETDRGSCSFISGGE